MKMGFITVAEMAQVQIPSCSSLLHLSVKPLGLFLWTD